MAFPFRPKVVRFLEPIPRFLCQLVERRKAGRMSAIATPEIFLFDGCVVAASD
jgi:hypothetical protein